MDQHYVEKRDNGYWITGSRISLESVIYAFLDGFSPETIAAECFPLLTLEQVYGAITYYLSYRQEINAYLKAVESEFDSFQQATNEPEFSQKMAKARRELQPT
jgi:uncharacterized protein (DUF433 family)